MKEGEIFGGGEDHEKSMKTPSVGEKRQFLSDSKKHEFWSKMSWKWLVL